MYNTTEPHRTDLRYIQYTNNLIEEVQFFIPRQHADFLSQLESQIKLPDNLSNLSEKKKNSKDKQDFQFSKAQKTDKVITKNFLTNIGTFLNHYMYKKCNKKELALFISIFGSKRSYKSLAKFSKLFASQLQNHCIQFFTKDVLKSFIKSNTSDKSLLIKYLSVLRQGAIKGSIKILKI